MFPSQVLSLEYYLTFLTCLPHSPFALGGRTHSLIQGVHPAKTDYERLSTKDWETMHSCSEQPPTVMTAAINGLGSKISSPSVTPFFFWLLMEFTGIQSQISSNPIKGHPPRPKPRTPNEQIHKATQSLHSVFWKVRLPSLWWLWNHRAATSQVGDIGGNWWFKPWGWGLGISRRARWKPWTPSGNTRMRASSASPGGHLKKLKTLSQIKNGDREHRGCLWQSSFLASASWKTEISAPLETISVVAALPTLLRPCAWHLSWMQLESILYGAF